jgi:hypothetical protein
VPAVPEEEGADGVLSSASDDEVGGYQRVMREQQAQKSCDEIENKNSAFRYRHCDLGLAKFPPELFHRHRARRLQIQQHGFHRIRQRFVGAVLHP